VTYQSIPPQAKVQNNKSGINVNSNINIVKFWYENKKKHTQTQTQTHTHKHKYTHKHTKQTNIGGMHLLLEKSNTQQKKMTDSEIFSLMLIKN